MRCQGSVSMVVQHVVVATVAVKISSCDDDDDDDDGVMTEIGRASCRERVSR